MKYSKENVDKYFYYSNKINESRHFKNYEEVLKYCKLCYPFLEDLIRWDENFSGTKWDGTLGLKIPAIEFGSIYFAIYGRLDELINLKNIILRIPELKYYFSIIDNAFNIIELRKKIMILLNNRSDVFQKDLKKYLDLKDNKLASRVAYYLEQIGMIKREKIKDTYKLSIA